MSPEPSYYVRRIVLPSGKTIEVLYFEDRPAPEQPPIPADADEHADDLTHCGTCNSRLVYPMDWHEAGSRHWEVTLRCPNCEWVGTGIFDQAVVDRFDLELDRQTRDLAHALERIAEADQLSVDDLRQA